jgi:hypothetical protein
MLPLVVQFAIFDTDDYFTLVAFQMARLTQQTIAMRHYQEKVMHVLLFVVWFIVLDANNYFALVVFQMVSPTLYIA